MNNSAQPSYSTCAFVVIEVPDLELLRSRRWMILASAADCPNINPHCSCRLWSFTKKVVYLSEAPYRSGARVCYVALASR